MRDVYRGIEPGDTVERVMGFFRGHKPGTVAVVVETTDGHLRFEAAGFGYAASAYRVIKRGNPMKELFERRTTASLMQRGGQA